MNPLPDNLTIGEKYDPAMEIVDEIWFMPADLVERWLEACRRGWERVADEERHALLGDTRAAIREHRIGRIINVAIDPQE